LQDEVIVALRLHIPGPDIDESRRPDYERDDYFAFRWWPTPDILTSGERFYPANYPRCSPPSSTATRSTNRSSCGHDPAITKSRSTGLDNCSNPCAGGQYALIKV
jgi:hypothetical protein